jgi:PAS domain S-box-containing protein
MHDGPVAAELRPGQGDAAETTAEERLRFLAEAGETLASSLNIEATLAAVAELAVPRLADWCTVHIVSREGGVEQLTVAHVNPDKVAWARELQERYPYDPDEPGGLQEALRTGQPQLYPEITDEMIEAATDDPERLDIIRRLGIRSGMVVPMSARGYTVGAITFIYAESPHNYGPDDLATAMELARRAALAVDNARLYQASQEAEARYRGLFEGLADAVIVTDVDGRYLEINPAFCDLLGYTREEVLASRVGAFTTNSSRAQGLFRRIIEDGLLRGEGELRRKDGGVVQVEVWARRVDLPSGAVNLGVMRDITERKAMEQMHRTLLDSIAHDLKNPLTALIAQTQLLRRHAANIDDPRAGRVLEGEGRMEAIAARLASQVEELQDVARVRAGEPVDLQRETTDLVAMVEQVVHECQLTTNRHVIRVETAEPSVVGWWDQQRLTRVMANLLTNAVKYSPDGGDITVRIAREPTPETDATGDWASLTVRDEGVGIPASDLPHVFDLFHRGSNVIGRFSGSGIGLSGARQIIEQHGGTISVESEEGVGSVFTIRLPR